MGLGSNGGSQVSCSYKIYTVYLCSEGYQNKVLVGEFGEKGMPTTDITEGHLIPRG